KCFSPCPAILPHPPRDTWVGSPVHTIHMAGSGKPHGRDPWNRQRRAADRPGSGQVEEGTVTTATRDRQAATAHRRRGVRRVRAAGVTALLVGTVACSAAPALATAT